MDIHNSHSVVRTSLPTIAVVGLAFLVVAIVWSLITQNRALKDSLERATIASSTSSLSELQPGEQIATVDVMNVDGNYENLSDVLNGETTVVTVFHTTCPYCEGTLPAWRELNARLEAVEVDLVGISFHARAATTQYLERHAIDWPVWTLTKDADKRVFKVVAVPTTIVVSAGGTVLRLFRGVISPTDVEDVLELLESRSGVS